MSAPHCAQPLEKTATGLTEVHCSVSRAKHGAKYYASINPQSHGEVVVTTNSVGMLPAKVGRMPGAKHPVEVVVGKTANIGLATL